MSSRKKALDLLVVDGYNVMGATPRYAHLIDEKTNPRELDTDPFVRAREALVSDVAAFAQGSYEAVIVFDGAGNLSPERPEVRTAGVRLVFSQTGESADEVIERLVTQARQAGRPVSLVTSDNTVRATAGGTAPGVTRLSSSLLVHEIEVVDAEVERAREERTHQHLTLGDRLSEDERRKLWRLIGR